MENRETGFQEKAELQDRYQKYLTSIEREFPGMRRSMIKSGMLPRMREFIEKKFTWSTVLGVASDVGKQMMEETGDCLNMDAVKLLLKIVEDRIPILVEAEESVKELELLKRCLEIEIRGRELLKESESLSLQYKELTADRSLLGLETASAICLGYIEMSQGKKPEEIKDLPELLLKAKTLLKMQEIVKKSEKNMAENMEMLNFVRENGNIRDDDKLNTIKELLQEKIRDFSRRSRNYQDLQAKKQLEDILAEVRVLVRISRKGQELVDIVRSCEMYFAVNGSGDDNNMLELLGLSNLPGNPIRAG